MTVSAGLWRAFRPTVSNQVLLLLCLMYLILYVDRVNISTAAPLIKAELGLSNTELGFVFSAFAYPYALFQLIGGWLGDRFGARRTLGFCGLVVCAATVLTGAAGSFFALLAAPPPLRLAEGPCVPTPAAPAARSAPHAP